MFFQIGLIAAGIHIGRTLWKKWSEPPRSGSDGSETAPPSSRSIAPAEPSPEAALQAEDALVQEQIEVALASTGISLAATRLAPGLGFLGGIGVLCGSIPTLVRARQLLVEERKLGIEVLDSISLLVSIVLGEYTLSGIFLLLSSLAEKLRIKVHQASRDRMLQIAAHRSENAWLLTEGTEVSVPADSLRPDDLVVVEAGGVLPADGIVVAGSALLDQHRVTGEQKPIQRSIGEAVYGMSEVLSGRLCVRVQAAGEMTAAAELAQSWQRAADRAADIESATSKRIADATAFPILLLSAGAAYSLGAPGALALLNVSIPDTLRLFAPANLLNVLHQAHDQGILFRDDRPLRLLLSVDTVVLDQSALRLHEELLVRRILPEAGVGEDELLLCAAAAESGQGHPIARALVRTAVERGHDVVAGGELRCEPGYGVSARVDGSVVHVGSQRYMELHKIPLPDSLREEERGAPPRGCSLVYVARRGRLAGRIEIEPVPCQETVQALRALRLRGLSLCLLSGAREEPTRALAERYGFEHYLADLLPEEKARTLRRLQQSGREVCFVGSGVRDAAAFGQAAVSVALRSVPAEIPGSAQIVLMEPGIRQLPQLFALAEEFKSKTGGLFLSAMVPTAVALGGVFFAGLTNRAILMLHAISLAAGASVLSWPHRHESPEPVRQQPERSLSAAE